MVCYRFPGTQDPGDEGRLRVREQRGHRHRLQLVRPGIDSMNVHLGVNVSDKFLNSR
jgi:hypothetical protein